MRRHLSRHAAAYRDGKFVTLCGQPEGYIAGMNLAVTCKRCLAAKAKTAPLGGIEQYQAEGR